MFIKMLLWTLRGILALPLTGRVTLKKQLPSLSPVLIGTEISRESS